MSSLQGGPIKDFALGIYDGPHATTKEADEGQIFFGIKNVTPQGALDFSEILSFPRWSVGTIKAKSASGDTGLLDRLLNTTLKNQGANHSHFVQ